MIIIVFRYLCILVTSYSFFWASLIEGCESPPFFTQIIFFRLYYRYIPYYFVISNKYQLNVPKSDFYIYCTWMSYLIIQNWTEFFANCPNWRHYFNFYVNANLWIQVFVVFRYLVFYIWIESVNDGWTENFQLQTERLRASCINSRLIVFAKY